MEKSSHLGVHEFWLETCGYDTHHRGANYAQLDTPWNCFSPNGILVCTIWRDQIASVTDDGVTRRFVSLGGKLSAWQGVAVQHGAQAEFNMRLAMRKPLKERRIAGFEAEPNIVDGSRRVRHFYMNDPHELEPIIGITGDMLIARLDLRAALEACDPELASMIVPGIIFELKPLREPRPNGDSAPAVNTEQTESEKQGETEGGATATQLRAEQVLPLLVSHLQRASDNVLPSLTYGDVAEGIGWFDQNGKPHAHGIGRVLHRVMEMIDSVGAEWQEQLPFLTTIVVAASGPNRGLPESGIESRWPSYQTLSRAEKQARIIAEYSNLIAFGPRWELVLEELGLAARAPANRTWRGGGESDEHRALKHYVRSNPHEFGANINYAARVEYALRSADVIDVFFHSPHEWIGVEVKSRISDRMVEDYERGIYQVVKYKAVLSAQASVEHPKHPPRVRVLLALERSLPPQYRDLARLFGVEVRENIGPGFVP